jgi:hypothetical protein
MTGFNKHNTQSATVHTYHHGQHAEALHIHTKQPNETYSCLIVRRSYASTPPNALFQIESFIAQWSDCRYLLRPTSEQKTNSESELHVSQRHCDKTDEHTTVKLLRIARDFRLCKYVFEWSGNFHESQAGCQKTSNGVVCTLHAVDYLDPTQLSSIRRQTLSASAQWLGNKHSVTSLRTRREAGNRGSRLLIFVKTNLE